MPLRLVDALEQAGVESTVLTMYSKVEDSRVHCVKQSFGYRLKRKIGNFFYESELNKYPSRDLNMPFSNARIGIDIRKNDEFKDSDVVILHWIWGNFISIKGIEDILKSGKKVIMVCHDNCFFTGGCHVRMSCDKYKATCGNCPLLNSRNERDYTYQQLLQKKEAFKDDRFVVVSPSKWMDQNVADSTVLKDKRHCVIPNPIDTDFFYPSNKAGCEKRHIKILFGAVNAISTPYKGFKELEKALSILEKCYAEIERIDAYVFGSSGNDDVWGQKVHLHFLGYLQPDEMVKAYNMVDVYVVPSLEDSFNSTVAEALSVETPVVAFATGGIVDIIDHKENGYLAEYGSAQDLAEGIYWAISNNGDNVLGKAGRKKVEKNFSYKVVGNLYRDLIFGIE